MKMNVISLVLLCCLVLSAVPIPTAKAISMPPTATGNVQNRVNQLKTAFPDGSFFTVSGEKCDHGSNETCTNCQLSFIMNAMGYSGTQGLWDAWTCMSFARFGFWYMFGASDRDSSTYTKFTDPTQAKEGDFYANPSYPHYGIFLSYNETTNTITLLDGNARTSLGVGVVTHASPNWTMESDSFFLRANTYDSINGSSSSDDSDHISVTGVNLSSSMIFLSENSTSQLTATIFPSNASDKSVIWESSDTSVAAVSSTGLVQSVGSGSAIITVTTADGGKKATCSVGTMVETTKLTSVALDKNEVNMVVGDSCTLEVSVFPTSATNQTVFWNSSDSEVVIVDNLGTLDAVSIGTSFITVTSEDGGKTDTCVITVSEQEVGATSLSLNKSQLSLNVGDSEILTATIFPSNATNTVVYWNSSDESVAKVDDFGEVEAISKGSATISATTEDGQLVDTCTVTVDLRSVAYHNSVVTESSGNGSGGSVELSTDSADVGTKISIFPIEQEGFRLDSIKVIAESGEAVLLFESGSGYFFLQPESDTTIVVKFVPETSGNTGPNDSATEFFDVKTSDWFYETVNYVTKKGLMTGTDLNVFEPNAQATRGMIVTILYSYAGKPDISGVINFEDVSFTDYFAIPVIWAQENDIVSGVSNTHFAPNDPITREQLMAILYKYEKNTNKVGMFTAISSKFVDRDNISTWAYEAMAWGISNGLISGRNDNALAPEGTATRAEIATILKNYDFLHLDS